MNDPNKPEAGGVVLATLSGPVAYEVLQAMQRLERAKFELAQFIGREAVNELAREAYQVAITQYEAPNTDYVVAALEAKRRKCLAG